MALLLGRVVPLLCILVIPATFAKRMHGPETSDIFGSRLKKATRAQKNRTDVGEFLQPNLRFKQAPAASMIANEFGSAVLQCEAWGNPPPTIHWLKDGRRLSLSEKDLVQEARDEEASVDAPIGLSLTRSRLYLDCLVSGDEAMYSCVAENPFKRISTDTRLTVRPPGAGSDEATGGTSELCLSKKAFGSPARIHMWTYSRLELQGSDALLFCRTYGLPQPTVQWVMMGTGKKPITSGGKYQVLPSGDLLIRDLVWEDQGYYLCLAENERGADETSTFLYTTAREKSA